MTAEEVKKHILKKLEEKSSADYLLNDEGFISGGLVIFMLKQEDAGNGMVDETTRVEIVGHNISEEYMMTVMEEIVTSCKKEFEERNKAQTYH